MTPADITAMPRELRDAGSEGRTLKDAWETCEKSAELIEDQIAELAKARATIIADAAIKAAQAAEIERLHHFIRVALGGCDANGGDKHAPISLDGGKYFFCKDCGETISKAKAKFTLKSALEGTPK